MALLAKWSLRSQTLPGVPGRSGGTVPTPPPRAPAPASEAHQTLDDVFTAQQSEYIHLEHPMSRLSVAVVGVSWGNSHWVDCITDHWLRVHQCYC